MAVAVLKTLNRSDFFSTVRTSFQEDREGSTHGLVTVTSFDFEAVEESKACDKMAGDRHRKVQTVWGLNW